MITRSEIDVLTPQTIGEALDILHAKHPGVKIVAGGSDVIVQLRDGIIRPERLVNILSLKELRYIRRTGDRIRIGALATYSDIIQSENTRRHAWVLAKAAGQIGAVQLQNTATIGGNLGNASPAGDSLPPLYALDAVVATRSNSGRREFPIEEFFVGYRKTALRADELIEEVYFNALGADDRAAYVKLGLREANAISIVDVAVVLKGLRTNNSFKEVRIALGAVAPTVIRARRCEQELVDKPLTKRTIEEASARAVEDSAPIDDIRASADYRKSMIASVVFQALYEASMGKAHRNE